MVANINSADPVRTLSLDAAAMAEYARNFDSWQEQARTQLSSTLREIASKAHGQELRIAGTLACLADPKATTISVIAVQAAHQVVANFFACGQYLVEQEPSNLRHYLHADRVVRLLQRGSRLMQIEWSVITQSLRRADMARASDWEPVLELLVRHGYIRRQVVPTGGRPSTVVQLNPWIWGTPSAEDLIPVAMTTPANAEQEPIARPHGRPWFPLNPLGKKGIIWTEMTLNPVHGCTPFSLGCVNGYCIDTALHLQRMRVPTYENGFALTFRPDLIDRPRKRRKPTLLFLFSMSDIFHEDIPEAFIRRVVEMMRETPWHRYQILTKRAERMAAMNIDWPPNVWLGVTTEAAQYASRIDLLRRCNARVKWLSIEPLLGPMPGLDLSGIDWVVVGGESGDKDKARFLDLDWVRDLRDQCLARRDTAFFYKQESDHPANQGTKVRLLDGVTWDEMPHAYGQWKAEYAAAIAAAGPESDADNDDIALENLPPEQGSDPLRN